MRVELATKVNPLGLKMGERVIVKRRSYVDYDVEGKNKCLFKAEDKDEAAFVIGSVARAVGRYVPTNKWNGDYGFGGGDYEPARLDVEKFIRLYECRLSFPGAKFLVHPNDIKMIEEI